MKDAPKNANLEKEKAAHSNCDRSESMKRYHAEKASTNKSGGKKSY